LETKGKSYPSRRARSKIAEGPAISTKPKGVRVDQRLSEIKIHFFKKNAEQFAKKRYIPASASRGSGQPPDHLLIFNPNTQEP